MARCAAVPNPREMVQKGGARGGWHCGAVFDVKGSARRHAFYRSRPHHPPQGRTLPWARIYVEIADRRAACLRQIRPQDRHGMAAQRQPHRYIILYHRLALTHLRKHNMRLVRHFAVQILREQGQGGVA